VLSSRRGSRRICDEHPAFERWRSREEGPLIGGSTDLAFGDRPTLGDRHRSATDRPSTTTTKDLRLLTIKAERSERQETKGRTEFTYGSSTRSVALPEGANEDAIAATYEKGILTIAVPIAAAEASEPKHVTITSTE